MCDGIALTDRGLCTLCGGCVAVCPAGARAIAGEAWSVEGLIGEIERDLLFYDESGGGVTVSGGEPLAQASFVVSLLTACRERRIHTAVDTCGYADWEKLENVAGITDLFLYDVKHMDEERHRELTGVSNKRILKNLRQLSCDGHALWIRYPVIPGWNDAQKDITALGEMVAGLESVEAVHLLPFHRGGQWKLERLGRTSHPLPMEGDARTSADAAAETLRRILSIPIRVGA